MLRKLSLYIAVTSLMACILAPVLRFLGRIDMAAYRGLLALATVCWFVFATIWALRPSHHRDSEDTGRTSHTVS